MNTTTKPLDFMKLVEKTPLTRLSKEYQNKLIQRMKTTFNDTEQQLFVSSFYCYLNYHSKNDFVIDLDNVWKWLGFADKGKCKRVLLKHFIIDLDYKSALLQIGKPKNEGGHNKETILLNIHTFKKLCLKSNTKKADEIHEYFIKLEELFQTIVQEETNELKEQLEYQFLELNEEKEKREKLQEQFKNIEERHKRLLHKRNRHKLKKGDCLYIIKNPYVPTEVHQTIFGITKNLHERMQTYHTYFIPEILFVMYTLDYKFLESAIKRKFRNHLDQATERINGIPLNEITDFIISIADSIDSEYTVGDYLEELEEKEDEKEEKEQLEEEKEELDLENKTKICDRCKQELHILFFSRRGEKFRNVCKVCDARKKQEYKIKKQKEVEENNIQEKMCDTCQETKPISHFTPHLYTQDGYVKSCKECMRKQLNEKRKNQTDNQTRHECECGKDFSRIDVLNKHKQKCEFFKN